jgi:CHAT domain-containing protein
MHNGSLRLVCVAGALGCAGWSQTPLSPASSIAVTLHGSAETSFTISLPANQTLEFQVIEQLGDPGIFTFLSPDGKTQATLDVYQRRKCVERTLIPRGVSRILVEPRTHPKGDRTFEIRTTPLRPISDDDRLRMAGEKILSDAEQVLRDDGSYRRAISLYQTSLPIWTRLSDRSHQAYALMQIADREQVLTDLQPALTHMRQAFDLWTSSGDNSCAVEALRRVASIENELGDKAKAGELAAQALAMSRSFGDSTDMANSLLVQGQVLEARGEMDDAAAGYREAIRLAHDGSRPFFEAGGLMFLAVLEHNRGNWNESLDLSLRTLAIYKDEGAQEGMAEALAGIAANYRSLGELREAISYSEKALPIFRELSEWSRYGNSLYNLASCHSALDDYPKALKIYGEALPLFRKLNSAIGQAYVLMGLGQIYRNVGDDQRADSYFRQATAEWRKTNNKQEETFALNATAEMAARRRQFSKAADLYQQALAISRAAGFQRSQEITLAGLSELSMSKGDARGSLDFATQESTLANKTGDQQQESVALFQQGRAQRALRNYDAAREALEKANTLSETVGNRVQQSNVTYELAALDRDTGQLEAGRDRLLRSLDALEQAGANAGSAESRMLFAASHRKSFDLAVDIEMQMREPVKGFGLSERARARTLVDLIRGARLDIRQGADPALLDRERHVEELLDATHDRLMRMLGSSHSPASEAQARSKIDELLQQYRDVEDEIRRQSPRYSALIEPRTLSIGDVQAELPDSRTALIEFWMGNERSYAWLITKSECRGVELPASTEIEGLARRAYKALNARNTFNAQDESMEQRKQRLAGADREFDRLSQELSRLLLKPLPDLAGFHRLWIVSDGALEYVPFAALPLPGTRTPLVADHEIVRLPSASVIAEIRSEVSARRPAPLSVAVFADPVFRADDERFLKSAARQAADTPRAAADVDLNSLPRLYFSRQEADAIARFSPGGKSREILDFDASRTEVKKPGLRDYRVVHFATHALLDSKNPELSGLVMSMIDREGRPQDGFLRLHEVYSLKLNADLVVLSACSTALGTDVRGEGLIGLTRGFMYAGAPQVMATLWGIRDNATTWFMTRFYESLLERHQTPEAALRAAQLAMRQDPRWSQPYYWAAFTMQGAR